MVSFIFIIISAILFQSSNIETKPVGWEKSFVISPYSIKAQNVKVTANGSYIIAVYEGFEKNRKAIYASISVNGGTLFFPPKKIAGTLSSGNNRPFAAVSKSGKVTVVWHDFIESEAVTRIFYISSNDLGATWTDPERVVLANEFEMHPQVFYDNKGKLHLFYQALKNNNFNLFHAQFDEKNNIVFNGTIVSLSDKMRGAFSPDIHFSGENIFVIWQARSAQYTEDLYMIKSTNVGRSWSSKEKITASTGNNQAPSVLLHKDTLYVAYQNNDEKTWTIKLKKGTDYGDVWSEQPITISTTNANCYSPKIIHSGNEVIIVWYDLREGSPRIYSRRVGLSDNTLSEEVKLSLTNNSARNPEVVFANNRAIIFWESKAVILGKYNDVAVSPPVVFSRTHPLNKWSRSGVAVIEWQRPGDESGIAGYATVVNRLPYFEPDPSIVNVKPNISRRIIPELNDGVIYFHIRAIDNAGNSSRTIHYKIQVASNPLPQPVVYSPTHPESRSSSLQNAVVKWSQDNKERLKGFVYTLSKGVQKTPRKFIKDFQLTFDDLDEGVYFFTIRALDKTDRYGKTATFPIVIGKDQTISRDDIRKIIDKGEKLNVEIEKPRVVSTPVVALHFPFDTTKVFQKNSFNAIVAVKNITEKQVTGYSIVLDKQKQKPSDRVNQESDIIAVKDLKNGQYFIGVKARYYRILNGKKKYFWTKPQFEKIVIGVPVTDTPTLIFAEKIIEKFYNKQGIILACLLLLIFFLMTFGTGRRFVFYLKMINYKRKLLYQRMFR